jgi:transcriptional regulator with XRE-family HTH domain
MGNNPRAFFHEVGQSPTMTEIWKKRLKEAIEERAMSMKALSLAAGKGETFIRDLFERDRTPSIDNFMAIAHILGKSVAFLLGEEEKLVKIVGKAGAGPDGSVLFATGDGYLGEVPAPEGSTINTRALEVQGDSMRGLANDGWLIFYDEKEFPSHEHMGEPCVCFLEDDRVLVKIPHPGSGPGLFHLESVNAPMMFDIPVRYFALITDIKPRRAATRHMKKNPHAHVEDVGTDGKRMAGS